VDAYLLTEGYLFGKRVELLLIFGDLARELDDEDLVLETLNVRQRFTEEIESFVNHRRTRFRVQSSEFRVNPELGTLNPEL
jgi:hypothetical protein